LILRLHEDMNIQMYCHFITESLFFYNMESVWNCQEMRVNDKKMRSLLI